MESGKEASVHIQLEGRPSILEMVSLWYSDHSWIKFHLESTNSAILYRYGGMEGGIQQIKNLWMKVNLEGNSKTAFITSHCIV